MNILFADSFDAERIETLTAEGHECRVEPALTADTLPEALGDAEILVVRSTKVSASVMDSGPALSLIIRAGAGVDNIDVSAAAARGIHVCNVPGKNAIAVAELAMGFILAIDRNIVDATVDLRNDTWNKARYTKAAGIHGSTLAIVGLGEIGLALAERARAFGMTVRAVRREGRDEDTERRIRSVGITLVDSVDELLGSADVVSIHVPSNAETKGMVDQHFLNRMRDGATLINTSRGDVIDESALLAALDGRGFSAGLDVFTGEPGSGTGEFLSALASHARVVGNHHVGASTGQAQRSVADGTLKVIASYAAGNVINCVNLAKRPPSECVISVRHLDRVGVLAQVFGSLRGHGLNVSTMSNRVFDGGQAAVADIAVDVAPGPELVAELHDIDEVLGVNIRIT